MTTIALGYRARQKKVSVFALPRLNMKLTAMMLALVCLAMLISYVWLVNGLTQGAFLVKSYQKQQVLLSKENSELEIQFAESEFLPNVREQVSALDFTKTTQVTYIQLEEKSVAHVSQK